jgi:hypothetical protein
MPRFVVLEHDHPALHWDFMLEWGKMLRTWRLPAIPAPGEMVPAEVIPDHRRIYLDYEGPVSGNRGRVRRWDGGTYREEGSVVGPPGAVRVWLEGGRLRGNVVLAQGPDGDWTFSRLGDRGTEQERP